MKENLDFERTAHRLELVLKGTGLGLWDWNPQTGEVAFDERWCRMLGYELHEIEPTIESWSSRVHPDDLQSCYDDIGEHIQGKTEFYRNTHRMKHRDGSWRYILDRGQIVERNGDGQPIRFTGSHEDVTESVKSKQDLNSALHALEEKHDREVQLYAVIGHELRTPAAVLQMLLDASEDGAQLDRTLLQANIEQLLSVIDTLRAVAQPAHLAESGFFDFQLHDLITEQVSSLRTLASRSGVCIQTKLDGLLRHKIHAQRTLIRQVTSNLIKNAIIHSAGTEVCVEASGQLQEDNLKKIKIVIEDNGKGIPEDDAIKIFEPFSRGASDAEGMGLGLHVCRNIAETMGGELHYEPSPTGGSRFILTLKVSTANPVPRPKSSTYTSLEGKRVLLAEDNPTLLLLTEHLLKKRGAIVVKGENGAQALAGYKNQGPFDVVITDIFMPVMDGYELIKELRSAGCKLPIVSLTAATIGTETEQALEAGADVVFNKPVDMQQLSDFLLEKES